MSNVVQMLAVWGGPCSGKTTTAVKLAMELASHKKKHRYPDVRLYGSGTANLTAQCHHDREIFRRASQPPVYFTGRNTQAVHSPWQKSLCKPAGISKGRQCLYLCQILQRTGH